MSKRIGMVTHDYVNVRDNAGTAGTNVIDQVSSGLYVTIVGEQMVGEVLWYHISYTSSGTTVDGWMTSAYMREITVDGSFEEYLKSAGFPESYWDSLLKLHAAFPNWQFQAIDTGLEWADVVAAECKAGVKLVHRNSPSHYIDWNDPYINTGRDGYYWVQASDNIVKYYLDPRNFLTDPYVFMFESQSYDPDNHTIESVENIIKNTFMKAANTFEADGKTYTHAEVLMMAAQASGVSPLHLASRLRQEQGTTGSVLAFGTVSGYGGYYNYFNYGAYPSGGNSSLVNGAIYAREVAKEYYGPWTNPLRAIMGGSILLGKNYINIGQDTVYFQCFNVVYKNSLYGHQYMTNVQAGETESQLMRNAYSNEELQEASLVFKIPVYKNMPESPCTQTGEPASPIKTDYQFKGERVTNIAPATTVQTFISKITVEGGSFSLANAKGEAKTEGLMATGDNITVTIGEEAPKVYIAVIFGDINGDGKINSVDPLMVQSHIVGKTKIEGIFLESADINGDGKVNSVDPLMAQSHIVGKTTIKQAR